MMTRSHSITNNTLLLIGGVCGAVLLLATIGVFTVSLHQKKEEVFAQINTYGDIIAKRENNRFNALETVQNDINLQLHAVLAASDATAPLSDANEALFNQLFPLLDDGTRRSIIGLYRGIVLPSSGYVDGIAAYIRDGATITNDRKRAFLAAFYIVANSGKRLDKSIDSLFYTSQDTDIIVYTPNRPQKVAFYRTYASNALEVKKRPIFLSIGPEKNPGRNMICIDELQRLNVPVRDRNLSTCHIPIYRNNAFMGVFGSVLELAQVYGEKYDHAAAEIDVALINKQGNAIVAPEFLRQAGFEAQFKPLASFGVELSTWLDTVLSQAANDNLSILQEDPDQRFLIASKTIDIPDWQMVLLYPGDKVIEYAKDKAVTVLISGTIGLLLLCIILALALRIGIGMPLEVFIAETRRLRKSISEGDLDRPAKALPTDRSDEIGSLARSFDEMAEQIIDAQRGLKERVELRTNQLNIEKMKAESASAAKTQFVASMSHELRTPLNAIVGFADMLRDEALGHLNEEALSHLDHLVQGAEHLRNLVDGVLDFAKLDVGSVAVKREAVQLSACFENALMLTQSQSALADISVTYDPETVQDVIVFGDKVRLVQVLVNLLTNAIKFNHKGGAVSMDVDIARSNLARITVRDTGPGIPIEQHARIFEPFERLSHPDYRRDGAGVGLSICRQLMMQMGGQIGILQHTSCGSTFWVDVPLHEIQKPQKSSFADETA